MKFSSSSFSLAIFHIVSSFCLATAADKEGWNHNQKIRDKVLKGYDKVSLPHVNANGSTTVEVQMLLRDLWLDDEKQVLNVNSWMVMGWQDDRLKWDYKDFAGIKSVTFADDEIWKPDLHVYNNADISEVDHYGNVHAYSDNNGKVVWVPPTSTKTPCPLDLKFWPFDQHQCFIRLGSWTKNGWQLDLELRRNTSTIVTDSLTKTNNWKIAKTNQQKVIFNFAEERYVELMFTFVLKRKSPTFEAVVVVPAIAIPLLLITQFILPVDHPKRLSIGFVCCILTLLEILFLKYSLPKLGTSVPLIVTYYSQCFFIVILTVALSTFLGRLSHPQDPLLAFPPPQIVKRVLTSPLSCVLCLQEHANKVGLSGKIGDDSEILESGKTPDYSHEWLLVAKAVDRIAFISFVCVFIFSLIAYVSPVQ